MIVRVATAVALLGTMLIAQPPRERGVSGFAARWEKLKATLTESQMRALLTRMPKGGDLHNHHEYSLPMRTVLDLASKRKSDSYYTRIRISKCAGEADPLLFTTVRRINYQSLARCVREDYKALDALTSAERDAWVSAVTMDRPEEGRDELFDRIVRRLEELEKDPALMAELLVEQQRLYAKENILYLETQLDPRGFRRADGTVMPSDEGANVIRQRLRQPDSLETGVTVRMQVSVVRFQADAEARLRDAFDFVHRNRDLWVSVNLVGHEQTAGGGADRFLAVFRDLRRRYPDIPLALHGGESDRPGREVRDTLLLGAKRVGHGINLISDPETMLALSLSGRVLIEINLRSNQFLGYVPDLDKHPFPEYLRMGIPVCLNTDDRGAFKGSTLTDEYILAVKHFNLSWTEIRQIGRWSLEFAFVEPDVRARLLAEFDSRLRRFEAAN